MANRLTRVAAVAAGLVILGLGGFGLGGCYEDPTGCSERPDMGPCDAAFTMYWYNAREGECQEFIWGGCEGNVPFETLAECRETCERD